MRIAQIHNEYLTPGGEDVVVEREKTLLENDGHEVIQFIVSNGHLKNFTEKVKTALFLPYSVNYKKKVKEFLKNRQPDVVHVHNFLPVLTASVFYACKELNFPVVLTIHNYRLICIRGILYRNNGICEQCISKKVPLNGILNGCYQNSALKSIFPVFSNGIHNFLNTWNTKIDKIILLTEFSKSVFDRSSVNLSEENIVIKPNFVEDRGYAYEKEDYYLFVGRLSEEKGILTVIETFKKSGKNLIISGEGPLESLVLQASGSHKNISLKGFIKQEQLLDLYINAKAVIFASAWYEGLPLVIIESFSFGTPVICCNVGNADTLVKDGINGMKFIANDEGSLFKTIEKYEMADTKLFCKQARATFEAKYTPEKNITQLMDIYEDAITNNAVEKDQKKIHLLGLNSSLKDKS